jgi:putative ABC transport system ATP-binding protein
MTNPPLTPSWPTASVPGRPPETSTLPALPPSAGAAAAPAAARTRGLVKVYGEGPTAVRALDAVDVAFEAHRFTAIMGPSGSGKSTLLHCVAGLDSPTSGEVWIGDTEISGLSDDRLTLLRRDRIGFVFQGFNLLPMLTAGQNVVLPLELAGRRPDRAWADHVVQALGLTDRMHHRPAELSGGQQQRVAIARALLPRPQLVVADEPTGNLDSRSGAEVLGLLRSAVRELGQTVVMVTHDPVAAAYADRVLLLADGRLHGVLEAPTVETVSAAVAGAELRRAG